MDIGYLWLIVLIVLLVAIVCMRAKAWNDFLNLLKKQRKK